MLTSVMSWDGGVEGGGGGLTSGLRLETRSTEWMVVGTMPWMVIRPVIADEGMVRCPIAPGIACIDRPERSGARWEEGRWKERGERRGNMREGKGNF